MKKIIAAAVAAAFVAPAAFAEITVSGTMGQYIIAEDVNDAGANANRDRIAQETAIVIGGATETDTGIAISATYALNGNGDADGGDNITVSSTFGTLRIGDVNSATDAIDDRTEIFESIDPLTGSPDSAVHYSFPQMVEGLNVHLSWSPENGQAGALSVDEDFYVDTGLIEGGAQNLVLEQATLSFSSIGNEGNGGKASDEMGFSFDYTVGPVRFAAGQSEFDFTSERWDDTGTQTRDRSGQRDLRFYGIQYSANGLMVAYEDRAIDENRDDEADVKIDASSLALSYQMGDLSFRAMTSDSRTTNDAEAEVTAYGVHYAVGGGLTVIAETGELEVADDDFAYDFTTVGLKYSF